MPAPTRLSVERRSAPVLVALSRQPPWLLPVVSTGLLLVSLALPGGLAAVPLLLLLLLVGWLTYLSWPVLHPPARLLRAVVLAVLAILAATRR